MKLGQLIEYNIRDIFLEKSYLKCGGETISRSFSRKTKIEHGCRSIVESFIKFIFLACLVEGYQAILKPSCRPLTFTSYKALQKRALELVSLPHLL